jgi:hypothetical protein
MSEGILFWACFTFFEPRIVVYTRNKKQQNAHFSFNDLIQLLCLRYVSNIQQDLYMQFYAIFSCIHISSLVHVINLHVQVFLKMNTWTFETCRRHYSWIESLNEKCAFWCLLLQKFWISQPKLWTVIIKVKCRTSALTGSPRPAAQPLCGRSEPERSLPLGPWNKKCACYRVKCERCW